MYLRQITEEEGLVMVTKTWTDSGVWTEPLKQPFCFFDGESTEKEQE